MLLGAETGKADRADTMRSQMRNRRDGLTCLYPPVRAPSGPHGQGQPVSLFLSPMSVSPAPTSQGCLARVGGPLQS